MQQHDLTIPIRTTPYEHHAAYARLRRAAEVQLSLATTAKDRRWWQHQIDRADNQLLRWQAQIDKEMRP